MIICKPRLEVVYQEKIKLVKLYGNMQFTRKKDKYFVNDIGSQSEYAQTTIIALAQEISDSPKHSRHEYMFLAWTLNKP